MDKIEKIARKLRLSADFPARFQAAAQTLHIRKNDWLVRQGKTCHYIGIVQEGALYAYVDGPEKQVINELYLPGSFITYYRSFITQLPASGAIQAAEDAVILAFSFEQYQQLSQSMEWLQFFKYLADSLFIRKCAREHAFLHHAAKERLQQLISAHPDVEQRFPQYKIASYLGIDPATLSRIKSVDLHQEK